ncbi:hypothetical protein [Streptomyces sp. NPDC056682]|uniref:hypothetical protein n=1 Tax=Streptomyces sp. NPDC056682 TaxID=3345909 RepID=UPI0036C417F7
MNEIPDLTDYVWPACTACGKALWVDEAEAGRQACRPCEARAAQRLAELPALFARLNTIVALMRGARRPGAATTGSKEPPIPPRLEVLALTGPGGVATELQAIEDAWRLALGRKIELRSDGIRMFAPWRAHPATAVPEHVNFLRINLERACERYESIGQDIEAIRKLHSEITAAVSGDPKPGRVKIGLCPTALETGLCGTQLTANTVKERIRCWTCGSEWDGEEGWQKLQKDQEKVLLRDTGIAA